MKNKKRGFITGIVTNDGPEEFSGITFLAIIIDHLFIYLFLLFIFV